MIAGIEGQTKMQMVKKKKISNSVFNTVSPKIVGQGLCFKLNKIFFYPCLAL